VFTELYHCVRGTGLNSFALPLMLLTLFSGLVYRSVQSAAWFFNFKLKLNRLSLSGKKTTYSVWLDVAFMRQ